MKKVEKGRWVWSNLTAPFFHGSTGPMNTGQAAAGSRAACTVRGEDAHQQVRGRAGGVHRAAARRLERAARLGAGRLLALP